MHVIFNKYTIIDHTFCPKDREVLLLTEESRT